MRSERSGHMPLQVVEGDLLDQRVDAIVNAWNRNMIPWWLLLPQGVSGAIKRRAGLAPFRELARMGAIPLGAAVLTSAGGLPFQGIIHVAGINLLWRASAASIQIAVRNAIALAEGRGFESIAFPVIGAGSGGYDEPGAAALITEEVGRYAGRVRVTLVRYRRPARKPEGATARGSQGAA